jgi:DinB superfamily
MWRRTHSSVRVVIRIVISAVILAVIHTVMSVVILSEAVFQAERRISVLSAVERQPTKPTPDTRSGPGAPSESLHLRRLLTFPAVDPSNAAVQGILSMKSVRMLPLFVLAMTIRLFAAPAMSNADREHLQVHFEMTTQMVAEQVRGLSPAQLEYKASPDRWSIREVVSHLAVAEPDYWREIQKAVKAAPDMKDKKSQATDADIMWYGIDRVVHTKTGGGHEKVDTYKDMGDALGRFQALRATMIGYIKSTDDDLRAHSFGDYGEVIDCWQWMLEISTHAERHIQQIREIKNDPNFPKK